ncbi:hypothetical protein RhoFasGS6_04823 [Rhodococcus fascians]|nr:hypothetical protein [Rhodococcus fascians]
MPSAPTEAACFASAEDCAAVYALTPITTGKRPATASIDASATVFRSLSFWLNHSPVLPFTSTP